MSGARNKVSLEFRDRAVRLVGENIAGTTAGHPEKPYGFEAGIVIPLR